MDHFLEIFDFAKFFSGLALLLFGLDLLESAVSGLGDSAQKRIQKYTKGTFKSILIGLLVTTILQSSSVVSLIIIAFVGSGIIGLAEGVGMMIGANIGTTLIDNLVAFLSFSEGSGFSIKDLIYPMIAIGGILGFFIKRYRAGFFGLLGLGIIFMGLDFMKGAMSILPSLVDLETLSTYPIYIFGIIGLVMAAAMHSSSGVTLLTITALASKLINLPMGLAIMIGANIGTCITAIEGSIGKGSTSKQIAYSHLFFNITTAAFFSIIFIRLPQIIQYFNNFMSSWMGYEATPEKALIWFIILFDIIGAILIGPFISYFILFLRRITPDSKSQNIPLLYIDKIDSLTGKFAIESLIKDIEYFYQSCKNYNLDQINIIHGQDNTEKFKKYNNLKNIYEKIMKYISNLNNLKLPQGSNTVKLQNIMNDCFYSVKYLEDIDHNIYKLYSSDNVVCREYFEYFVNKTNTLYNMLNEDPRNKKAIHALLSDIQIDDQYFIDKFINHDNDINSINGISDIITIHKYYYISCEDIVAADEILSNL